MQNTIGIEVETVSLPQNIWEKHSVWSVTTDGSIRDYRLRNPLFLEAPLAVNTARKGNTKFGAELVSPIISVNKDMWENIHHIFSCLYESGETSHANMSIHIHVGCLHKFSVLAKAIPFLKKVDKLLFDVSTAGQEPRGLYNNFLYYRPLKSPPWAQDGKGMYRPSIGNLEVCSSAYDFQFCMGRKELSASKWYPARYCGLNFASLFEHGTLEFRHFNFTNDFLILKAWIYLCLGIYKCIGTRKYITDLSKLIRIGGYNLESAKGLEYIIKHLPVSDVYSRIDMSPMATHTGRKVCWFNGIVDTLTVPREEIIPKKVLSHVDSVLDQHPKNDLEKPNSVTFIL